MARARSMRVGARLSGSPGSGARETLRMRASTSHGGDSRGRRGARRRVSRDAFHTPRPSELASAGASVVLRERAHPRSASAIGTAADLAAGGKRALYAGAARRSRNGLSSPSAECPMHPPLRLCGASSAPEPGADHHDPRGYFHSQELALRVAIGVGLVLEDRGHRVQTAELRGVAIVVRGPTVDPDFTSAKRVREMAASARFALAQVAGPRWAYFALFRVERAPG
jgi:hypothetical protein